MYTLIELTLLLYRLTEVTTGKQRYVDLQWTRGGFLCLNPQTTVRNPVRTYTENPQVLVQQLNP